MRAGGGRGNDCRSVATARAYKRLARHPAPAAPSCCACMAGGPEVCRWSRTSTPRRRGVDSEGSGHATSAGGELASASPTIARIGVIDSACHPRVTGGVVRFAPSPETARRGLTTRAGPLSFLGRGKLATELAPDHQGKRMTSKDGVLEPTALAL